MKRRRRINQEKKKAGKEINEIACHS